MISEFDAPAVSTPRLTCRRRLGVQRVLRRSSPLASEPHRSSSRNCREPTKSLGWRMRFSPRQSSTAGKRPEDFCRPTWERVRRRTCRLPNRALPMPRATSWNLFSPGPVHSPLHYCTCEIFACASGTFVGCPAPSPLNEVDVASMSVTHGTSSFSRSLWC